ncbi:unnamed protein product, partial [Didymodactylos carnosus]
MAGDCQGQAVTTTSLLISMGFNAWAVETPFHWWTHAEDQNSTLSWQNLNVHGNADLQGDVLPQPIDLVYTHSPSACDQCQSIYSQNQQSVFYAAPPHLALAIAYTSAHILVRSNMTLSTVNYISLILIGFIFGLSVTLYSSYYKSDWNYLN